MSSDDITQLLKASSEGDQSASEGLYRNVYDELRVIAHSHRRRWQGNETLNTTAIISEAYLKLSKGSYENRTHFYATASKAMRQVLISYAKSKKTVKRKVRTVSFNHFDDISGLEGNTVEELLALDQLLNIIEESNPRHSEIVECRVFGGMTIAETAEALNISPATVKRDWALLSAWLYRELKTDESNSK